MATKGAIEPGLHTTWHPIASYEYGHTLVHQWQFQGGGLISYRTGMLLKDISVCGYTLQNRARKDVPFFLLCTSTNNTAALGLLTNKLLLIEKSRPY